MAPHSAIVSLLPFLIFLPLLYLRMRKLARPQPLKLSHLWIRPVIVLALCAVVLLMPQPGHHAHALAPGAWVWFVLAAVLGAGAGWQMGRTMTIDVHPEDGTLMTRGGFAAMAVIAILLLVRVGLRTGLTLEAQAWHLDALLISDAVIIFTAVMFCVRALEMYLRARRVMARAHALP